MKRLLVFHPALAPYRVDFFNELGRRFDMRVVFMTRNNTNQAFNQAALTSGATYQIGYLDKHITVSGRDINFGYWKEITKFSPDIVICSEYGLSTISTYSYRLSHSCRFKIFTICDDSIAVFDNRTWARKWLRDFFTHHIDGIISTNHKVAERYQKLGARSAIYFPIIYNDALYDERMDKATELAQKLIKEFNLAGKTNVLYVGRLTAVKNLESLIRIYATLPKDKLRLCNLVLVGDGDLSNHLQQTANSLNVANNVKFAGRYEGDELLAWYAIGSFFVLPSTYERFGAVTAEAMQAGCRAMVSDSAGSNCLINSKNGYVFNPLDEAEFADTLKRMINESCLTPVTGFKRKSVLGLSFQALMDNLCAEISR